MKKYVFFVMGIVLSVLNVRAQSNSNVRALSVGETVPDIYFNNIVNYPLSSAKLSDFKDKVIILDFWATWCGPCVNGMPKLDTLQREFGDDLFVLPVTGEDATTTQAFFKRRNSLNFPSVVNGAYLKEYFPHTLIPHTIIIDKDREVIAITSSENITASVIDSIIDGHTVHLDIKNDVTNFDSGKPLMVKGNNEMHAPIAFRSMILPCMPDLPSTSAYTEIEGKRVGLNMVNVPIPHLFLRALNRPWQYSLTRMIFENVRDSTRYRSNVPSDYSSSSTFWSRKNLYSYDLIAPGLTESEQLSHMFQTLRTFFLANDRLTVTLVKRPFSVLVLRKSTKTEPRPSSSSIAGKFSYQDSGILEWLRISTAEIASGLEPLLGIPIVDSANIGYPLDIRFSSPVLKAARSGDFTDLVNILNKEGLDLTHGTAEIEAVLFKEN